MRQRLVLTGLTASITVHIIGDVIRRELATEHTAYTSLYRLKSAVQEKGFNAEAENASDTVLLNYDVSDVDLSKEDSVVHHLCMCLTAVISTQHLHMMLRQVII